MGWICVVILMTLEWEMGEAWRRGHPAPRLVPVREAKGGGETDSTDGSTGI